VGSDEGFCKLQLYVEVEGCSNGSQRLKNVGGAGAAVMERVLG